jgi:hypothetical protein
MANPAKAGDAKLRGYRTPVACHASRAAEALKEGFFMRSRTTLRWVPAALLAAGVDNPVAKVIPSADAIVLSPRRTHNAPCRVAPSGATGAEHDLRKAGSQ